MRVAVDLTPLLGQPTGVGVFTEEVTRHLADRDDVELVGYALSWRGRERLPALVPTTVPVASRPMAARPLRTLWRRFDHPAIEWWTPGVDVVHGTNFVVPPARRAAAVVTVHDLTPVRFPELCTDDTLAYPGLIRRAWRRGAWIHTPSRFVADEVRQWLSVPDADAHRVVPVAHGVTPMATGDPARGRRLAGADRYVLALGTIEPRKALVDLVVAFDAVADGTDADLVVAGPDGWGVESFDAAVATARHGARIHRLGWVGGDDRAALLAGATVLAYPSVYEGFGLPPLEAMSAGVPVVSSDAGPLPEVTGDAAVRVPVGDHAALAAALVDVITDPGHRVRLVAAGRRWVERFRWTAAADGLAALYRDAAAATRSDAATPRS